MKPYLIQAHGYRHRNISNIKCQAETSPLHTVRDKDEPRAWRHDTGTCRIFISVWNTLIGSGRQRSVDAVSSDPQSWGRSSNETSATVSLRLRYFVANDGAVSMRIGRCAVPMCVPRRSSIHEENYRRNLCPFCNFSIETFEFYALMHIMSSTPRKISLNRGTFQPIMHQISFGNRAPPEPLRRTY